MHSVKDSVFLWCCIGVLLLAWAGGMGAFVYWFGEEMFWTMVGGIVLLTALVAAYIAVFLYASAPSGRRAIDVLRSERMPSDSRSAVPGASQAD